MFDELSKLNENVCDSLKSVRQRSSRLQIQARERKATELSISASCKCSSGSFEVSYVLLLPKWLSVACTRYSAACSVDSGSNVCTILSGYSLGSSYGPRETLGSCIVCSARSKWSSVTSFAGKQLEFRFVFPIDSRQLKCSLRGRFDELALSIFDTNGAEKESESISRTRERPPEVQSRITRSVSLSLRIAAINANVGPIDPPSVNTARFLDPSRNPFRSLYRETKG